MDYLQEENLPLIDSKQDALQEYLLHLPLPNAAFSRWLRRLPTW